VEISGEDNLDETVIYDVPEHIGIDQADELTDHIESVDKNVLDETVIYDVPEHVRIDQADELTNHIESVDKCDLDETVSYVVPEHIGVEKRTVPIENDKDSTNNLNIDESVRRSKRVIQKPARYRNE
jgi:hypothetical protein